MNKKGFTLIELLAVIILIGVIGLISVPAISSTIEKQKKKSFRVNISGLLNAVKSDAENDKFNFPRTYLYSNNTLTLVEVKGVTVSENLQVGGKMENGAGTIKYNSLGELFVAIKDNEYCTKKSYTSELEYGIIVSGVCKNNNVTIDLSVE